MLFASLSRFSQKGEDMRSIFTALTAMLNQPSCLEHALLILALLLVLVAFAWLYPPAVPIMAAAIAPTAAALIGRAWNKKRGGPDNKV